MWFSVFWEVLNFLILTAISFVAGLCFWVGADPAGSAPTQKTVLRIFTSQSDDVQSKLLYALFTIDY